MANRHLSRQIALQSLFESDFRSEGGDPRVGGGRHLENIERIIARLCTENGEREKDFVTRLVTGVQKKHKVLDEIIAKAARDWPLDQTPLVDRNVLRLGLYELLFAKHDEVPARVAINEAIELGKEFGGEHSGKFINGVLGTIYKEMGEPGKDEVPKKKLKFKRKEELSLEEKEKLPLKRLVGAVVYHYDSKKNLLLAFVHDVFGYWTLSKGGVQENEDEKSAVVREIGEEMNLEIKTELQIGVNEYVATDPEVGNIGKRVTYFLATAANPRDIKLASGSGGLDGVGWFTLSEIEGLKMYPDVRPIIDKGLSMLVPKS